MLGQPQDSCCCQQCTVTKGQASLVSFYPHTPSARARRDFTRAYIQRQTTAYAEKAPSNCQMQKGHLRFQVSKPQFQTNTLLPPDGTGSKMPSPKLVPEHDIYRLASGRNSSKVTLSASIWRRSLVRQAVVLLGR